MKDQNIFPLLVLRTPMTFSLDNVFVFFGRRLLLVNLGSQIVNTILPNKTTTKKSLRRLIAVESTTETNGR